MYPLEGSLRVSSELWLKLWGPMATGSGMEKKTRLFGAKLSRIELKVWLLL